MARVSYARDGGETAFFASLLIFGDSQGVITMLLGAPGKVGEGLAAKGAIKKKDDQQSKSEGGRIEDAPNAPPAGLQWIVKDLFLGHSVGVFILRGRA